MLIPIDNPFNRIFTNPSFGRYSYSAKLLAIYEQGNRLYDIYLESSVMRLEVAPAYYFYFTSDEVGSFIEISRVQGPNGKASFIDKGE
jgi:hypothetical protein